MIDFPEKARPGIHLLWARLLKASGCIWWAKRQLRRREAITVLTFHRVLSQPEFRRTSSLPGMLIRRRTFARIAAYIGARYETVDFARARESAGNKLRVMFTFDDGWKDNFTHVLPILRAHDIPATAFICPGLIGRDAPYWPELIASKLARAIPPVPLAEIESVVEMLKTYTPQRRQQFIAGLDKRNTAASNQGAYEGDCTLTWEDTRKLAAGMTLGSHTHTHQILTTVPASTARQEIRESKQAIERALGGRCELFAYPNGNTSAAVRRILAEEGFAAAFTTKRGAWMPDCDRMAIPRMNVCEMGVVGLTGRFSPALFEYNVFWKAWRATREGERVPANSGRRPVLSQA